MGTNISALFQYGHRRLPRFLYSKYRVFPLGVKRSGGDVDHSHASSAEIKERAKLYTYSFSGLSLPVLG